MIQKWKLKTRVLGLFLFIKTLLPLLLFFFLMFLPYQVMNSENNRKLYNLYHHEIDVLMEHFREMEAEVNRLKANATMARDTLLKVRDQMLDYISEKGDAAEKFWASVKLKVSENTKEFRDFKALVEAEIYGYIAIVEKMIADLKKYVNDIFNYKDKISKFLKDFKKELEPLNDLVDAIEDLDVLDVFDPITFDFPDIPIFPKFPTIDLSQLKPDFSGIINEVKQIKDGLVNDITQLTNDVQSILTPPDLSSLIALFNSENLITNYLEPIQEMGSVLSSYVDELRTAQVLINDELLDRKSQLRPWNKALVWTLIAVLFFWFIGYMMKFRRKMKLAIQLMRGDDADYSPIYF